MTQKVITTMVETQHPATGSVLRTQDSKNAKSVSVHAALVNLGLIAP